MSKTILITGASSGIGKETAKFFQGKGWNAIATMRTPGKEEELTQLDNILITRLDVTDSSSINASVAEGIEKFGRIDVLLNNAGYGAYGPLEAFPMENIRRQFNTNVIGLLETTKAILPHFRENKAGTIVNISSIGGQMTFPLDTLYHGTKFAVEGLSEALHYELEPFGVKMKIVEPGMSRTDFGGRSFDFVNDQSEFRVQSSEFRVQSSEFRVQQMRLRLKLNSELRMQAPSFTRSRCLGRPQALVTTTTEEVWERCKPPSKPVKF